MSNEKTYTAREVALAILAKAQEILKKSELPQFEPLEKGTAQPSPVLSMSEKPLEKKYYGFEKVKEEAAKSGASDPAAVAAAAGRKKYGKKAFQEAAAKGKKMGKAENPDKDADAELGEKVEHDVEEHFKENKDAEEKEGHKLMVKCAVCGNMHKSEDIIDLCKSLKKVQEGFEELEKAEKHKKLADKVEHHKEGLKEALHEAKHPKKVLSDLRQEKVEKSESKHDRCVKEVKENSPDVKNAHAVCVAEGVKPAKWKKSEKTENKEEPSDSMHPRVKEEGIERDYEDFETQPGHSSSSENDHRQTKQSNPEENAKEKAEGNNPEAGTVPGNGVYKLNLFIDHRDAKNKLKKGICLS